MTDLQLSEGWKLLLDLTSTEMYFGDIMSLY